MRKTKIILGKDYKLQNRNNPHFFLTFHEVKKGILEYSA